MGGPDIPDPNVAAISGAVADVQNYPFQYQIEALARTGGRANIGGRVYDFTGLGEADNARVMSDRMAQTLLDIQRNYGADFIRQRLASLEQSDPEGFAARRQLFDRILADSERNPNRPLAEETQGLITDLLQQGGQLTDRQKEEVQQGVRGQQLRRGIYLGNAPASQEATAVTQAGEQMRGAREAQALQFQTSGISPEDVEYRRIQQSLQNLGAFMSGQTPTAQFGGLSAAGNGAAPFTTGGPMNVHTNPNAALQGIQNANAIYSGNVNWANSQVNPFVAGISGGMDATASYLNSRPVNSGVYVNPALINSAPRVDGTGFNVSNYA